MKFSNDAKRALIVLAAVVFAAAPAAAETIFEATLDSGQLVPPGDSTAYGAAVIVLNDAQTEAYYTVAFAGLDFPQTAAHFHHAPPGENGPPILTLELGSPLAGVWMLTPEDADALLAHEVYVNIHTEGYPSGEIRGNFDQSTVAAETTTWSQLKSLY